MTVVDTVPVVMGLVNYTRLLTQPGSFIDVRDFSSPEALAQYLHYLSANDTAYNIYIEQKHRITCKGHFGDVFSCRLCLYLHRHQGEVQIAKDIRVFWGVKQRCKTPEQFFHRVADSIIRNISKFDVY